MICIADSLVILSEHCRVTTRTHLFIRGHDAQSSVLKGSQGVIICDIILMMYRHFINPVLEINCVLNRKRTQNKTQMNTL